MDGYNQLRQPAEADAEAARSIGSRPADGVAHQVADSDPALNREVVRSISASASLGDLRNPPQLNISWRSIESTSMRSLSGLPRTDVTPTAPAGPSTSTSTARARPSTSTSSRDASSTATSLQPAPSSPGGSTVYMSLSTVVSSGSIAAFEDLPLHDVKKGSEINVAARAIPFQSQPSEILDAVLPTDILASSDPTVLADAHIEDAVVADPQALAVHPQASAQADTSGQADQEVEVVPGLSRTVVPAETVGPDAPVQADLLASSQADSQSVVIASDAADLPDLNAIGRDAQVFHADAQATSLILPTPDDAGKIKTLLSAQVEVHAEPRRPIVDPQDLKLGADEAQPGQAKNVASVVQASDALPDLVQPETLTSVHPVVQPVQRPAALVQPPSAVVQPDLTRSSASPQAAQALPAEAQPTRAQPAQVQAAEVPAARTAGPSNRTDRDPDYVPSPPKRSRKAKSKRCRKRKSPYVESEEDPSSADEEQELPTRFSPRNKRGYRF